MQVGRFIVFYFYFLILSFFKQNVYASRFVYIQARFLVGGSVGAQRGEGKGAGREVGGRGSRTTGRPTYQYRDYACDPLLRCGRY